jgi:hypothetical protein
VIVPIAGFKAIYCVKYRDANGEIALLLTTENGGITLDTVNNRFIITANSDKTDLIKKDELVYGQEKFSFPEETLTNAYSDCEDKAMLFAVLVNKVYGLKSVALYYKDADHINIAIESWKQNIKGNFVFNDHNYVICEPTGKGFNIGESSTSVHLASLIDW